MKTAGHFLFRMRSLTPIPFLAVCLILGSFESIAFYTGLIFVAAGEIIRLSAVGYLGIASRSSEAEAETLVTNGPFGFVRNPIYIGNISIYLGFSVLSNVFFPYFSFSVLIFFSAVYYCITLYEEDYLSGKMNNFRTYCEEVPRYFPKIGRFRFSGFTPIPFDLKKALKSERPTFLAIIFVLAVLATKYCTE
jgi:protein-S-isoprenylcysteine O-methyltransferase Ste14